MKSGASAKYPTMSLDEIKALPIKSICEKDCVLYLWTTTPFLPSAFEVMKDWGFDYKTAMFWNKQRLGLGFWFRGQVEILLFGKKGKVKAFRSSIPNIVSCKSTKHSKKPEEFRRIIERVSFGDKIEIFAREQHEGWDCWGDEV